VALYRAAHARPLRLFRYASRAYAEARGKKIPATPEEALAAARKDFAPAEEAAFGDVDDPYVAQLFATAESACGDGDDDDGFAAVAERVYGPLLAHRTQEKL
jgi:phytoene dehydrogenase-like protein